MNPWEQDWSAPQQPQANSAAPWEQDWTGEAPAEPATPPTEAPSYASRVGTAAGLGLQNLAAGAKFGLEQTAAKPVAVGAGLLDFATNVGEFISPIGIAKSLFAEKPAVGEPQDFLTAIQSGANKIFSAFADAPVTEAIKGVAPGALEFGVPGAQAYADETRAAIQGTNERLAANKASGGGFGLDVATGLAQIAPAVGVGLATRSPAATVATLAAPMFGQTLAEGDGDVGQRVQRAAAYTGAEFVTELPVGKLLTLPASAIVRELGKNGVAQVMGRIAKTAGAEGLQEAGTNILQDLYDNGALDENKTIGDIVKDAGYAGAVGALAGAVAGAPVSVAEGRQSAQATTADAQLRSNYLATLKEVDAGDGTTTYVDAAGTPVGDTLDEVNAAVAALPLDTIAQRMAAKPLTPEQEAQKLQAPPAQPAPNVSELPPGYFEAGQQAPLEPLTQPGQAQATPGDGTISEAELTGAGVDTSALGEVAPPPRYVTPSGRTLTQEEFDDAQQAKPLPALERLTAPQETQPPISEAELTAAGVGTAALGDVAPPTPEAKGAAPLIAGVPKPTNVQEASFDVNGDPAEIRRLYDVKGGFRIKNGLRFPRKLLPEFEQKAQEISAAPPVTTERLGEVAPPEDINAPARNSEAGRPGSAGDVPAIRSSGESAGGVGSGADSGRVRGVSGAGSAVVGQAAGRGQAVATLATGNEPDSSLTQAEPTIAPAEEATGLPMPRSPSPNQFSSTPAQENQNAQEVRVNESQVRQDNAPEGRQGEGGSNLQRTAQAGTEAGDTQKQVAPAAPAAEFAGPAPTATPSATPAAPTSKPVPAGAAGLTERLRRSGVDAKDGDYTDARLPGYAGEAVDAMATLFKKRVVVFRAGENAPKKSGGLLFPADPGTIYLNADANVHPAVVFMHELVHSMKRTDPKTYAALEKALLPMLRNREGYVQTRLGGKELGALTEEEMIADVMADHASDPKFWSDLYGRFDDKSAWQQFSDYIRRLLSNVIDVLYPVGAYRYIDDFNAAYEHVVDAAYNHARAQQEQTTAEEGPLESRPLPPPTDASRALDVLKNEDPSLYGRAKKLWKQGFFPGGLLRGDVAKRNFERQARIAGIGYEAGNAVGELERAVEQGYGKSYDKLTDAEVKNLQAALTGKPVTALPQPLQQAIVAMRQMIDRMSREYMDILRQQIAVKVATGEDATKDAQTLATIGRNLESYVNRSYRAFDDPKWWDSVDDGVVQRAVKYLADGYVAVGMSEKDANARANQVVASFKTGSAADSVESFIKESKLGAKDLSVLMRRKDVPQEIRALLGEYFDPRVNFTKSVAKMGRLIQNQQFLSAVRDMGMGSLFWEEGDLQRPAAARFPMAGERADTYSPLNGLLTTKDVAEAFQEAVQPKQEDGWYKWVVKANALVNYGKTILSPATQMRNFQSAAMFTLANGHFNWSKIADSYALLSSRYGGEAQRKEAQAYVKKLIDMGVLGDNANAGDFQAYLQSSGIDRLFDPDTPIGKFNRGAKALYQFSDDFWKIVGYENELAAQKRAGLSEDAAEMEAAVRIRNTYPTYSMAGNAIRALARSPIAGAFPTFSAEIIRNSYHIVRYAVNDIQQGLATGNKGQLRNGVQRLAGMALVNGAIIALGVYSAQSIGLDDDEEEAVRQLLPPWQQNSNIMWTGRDELGRPTFIDMSWMDVYGIWKRPITAALRDQPLDDAFQQAVTEFLSPFLGADIAIQAVWEVATNKRIGSNAPVYDEATKMEDIYNHLRRAAQPGAAANVERFWKAYKDEVKPGGVGEYSELEEALALVGWRWSKVDPALGLRSKSYDFADATKKAGVSLRKSLSSPNAVDDKELEQQVETAIELNAEAHKRLKGVVGAAMKTGLTKQQARNILENSGIGKKRAADIVNDRPVYFALSDRAEKDAIERAVSIPGRKDNRAEIRRRYALAEKMLREKQKGPGG